MGIGSLIPRFRYLVEDQDRKKLETVVPDIMGVRKEDLYDKGNRRPFDVGEPKGG